MIQRIPKNYVLVEVDSLIHDKILFKDGSKLIVDTTYEPDKHNQVFGVVHTAPDDLYFDPKEMEFSVEYDIPMEIKKGDKIFYHYLQISTAIKQDLVLNIGGKTHIFVRYDQCFCAMRGDQVIMLNGWMLLEPYGLEDVLTSEVIKIRPGNRRPHPLKGKIAHIGTPVNKYLWSAHESDDHINVKSGDKVMFLPYSDIPLEYGIHQTLDQTYYRVQRKDLLNKLI